MSLFRRAVVTEKLMNRWEEPIKGIKVWLLLGYPSNILGYPSK